MATNTEMYHLEYTMNKFIEQKLKDSNGFVPENNSSIVTDNFVAKVIITRNITSELSVLPYHLLYLGIYLDDLVKVFSENVNFEDEFKNNSPDNEPVFCGHILDICNSPETREPTYLRYNKSTGFVIIGWDWNNPEHDKHFEDDLKAICDFYTLNKEENKEETVEA